MDTEEMIPVTEDMTAAERKAARKHNRELMREQLKAEREKEYQILEDRYGNTDK